jgi:hypothetical protein
VNVLSDTLSFVFSRLNVVQVLRVHRSVRRNSLEKESINNVDVVDCFGTRWCVLDIGSLLSQNFGRKVFFAHGIDQLFISRNYTLEEARQHANEMFA